MKKRPSKSVIVKWALSYLLIFLIPVLVSLGLLYEVNHYVKNKISFANAQLLEQVKNALDGELENISDTLMEISVNEKLNTVARNSGALTPRSTYMMLELVKNYFPLLSSGNDLVGSLYVFCNEGQFVLTAGAKYSPEVAFETFYPGTGIAYAEWAALMQNVSNFEVQVMPMQGAAGQAASYTNLMLSISFKSDMPAANIVVVLDKNKLAEILKSVQWLNEGYMVVQNQNGDTI